MDLPVCPACGQSVLDDDASECPFCGASMSGKPGAGKPASGKSAAAAPKPAPAAPSGKASAGTTPAAAGKHAARSAAPGQPGRADREEIAAAGIRGEAPKTAATVQPRKSPNATLPVKCPMCETSGFVPLRAAGQPVRCANPDCLVPVFTAPAPPPKPVRPAPVAVPSKAGKRMAVIATVSVLGSLAVGAAAWWLFVPRLDLRTIARTTDLESEDAADSDPGSDAAAREAAATAAAARTTAEDAAAGGAATADRSPDAVRRQILLAIRSAAASAEPARKKDCRRGTTQTFALAGQLAEARKELQQLRIVASDVDYYLVTPLVEIAWQERAAGNAEGARSAMDEAAKLASKLPPLGQLSFDSAASLAALLIASDRGSEAGPLLAATQSGPAAEELWARTIAAGAIGTFDLDAEFAQRVPQPGRSPKSVAVVFELARHGAWDAAAQWIGQLPDPQVRLECTLALAEASAAVGPAGTDARIQPAVSALPKAAQAIVFARIALRRQLLGDEAGAAAALERARTELSSVPESEPLQLPGDVAGVYRFEPRIGGDREAALAAGEVARVAALRGEREAAWRSLERALAHCRALAPSLSAVQKLQSEIDAAEARVQQSLMTALGLQTDLQGRDALQKYRRKVRDLNGAAEIRFRLQAELLEQAVAGGLAEQVQSALLAAGSVADFPFEKSAVPWRLAEHFIRAGAPEKADAIRQAATGRGGAPAPEFVLQSETERLIADGQPAQAAKRIDQAAEPDAFLRSGWALRLVCRIVDADRLGDAAAFLAELRDPLLREEGYRLMAARAARRGKGPAAWETLEARRLKGPELVAAGHGLIAGLEAAARRDAATSPAE